MLLLLSMLVGTAPAADTSPMAIVGPGLRNPTLPLPADVQEDLRSADWDDAGKGLKGLDSSTFTNDQVAAHAFLTAWSLVEAENAAEALPLLDKLEGAPVPPAYLALVRGEVYLATEKYDEAAAALEQVDSDAVIHLRAVYKLAQVRIAQEKLDAAVPLLEQVIAQDDPGPWVPHALLDLAKIKGNASKDAYPLLRRVWYGYPRSSFSIEAARRLKHHNVRPTWQEVAKRAERLMYMREYVAALAESERVLAKMGSDTSVDACRLLYTRGRSYYKKNQLTNALTKGFSDAGDRCAGVEGAEAYGAKSLYLSGYAAFRKRQFKTAAAHYKKLPAKYPKHSMADDGYSRAGIALQEAGDIAGAQALWRKALDEYPDGDTVPESTWRLAWTLYLQGKPAEAIAIAERLGKLDRSIDPTHVEAGRYWSARWKLYPDVDRPTVAVGDPAKKAQAVAEWKQLCADVPHSFYSILAWSRLKEVAPDEADALRRARGKPAVDLSRPWVVRLSFLEDPHVRTGAELARLGLLREARAEWTSVDRKTLLGDEMAWMTELRIGAGDWLYAHDDMRSWLRTHPAGTLGPHEAEILRVGYPDHYWKEVRSAAEGDRYDLRLFHALVREESNFNREIVSFAGARGLSQLMPATARQVAGWLKMNITMADLFEPETNLRIGSTYYDQLIKQFNESPYLATAAYNSGGGRQNQWLGKWGNVPTDEYVERIPFRETRGYVKRVMGTWQTMRYTFDEQPFWDLSEFNHKAQPKSPGASLGKGL